jgi:hypothetical protein
LPSSSAYVLHPEPGRQVVLWGFGFFYGDAARGGLYLARFDFDPFRSSQSDLPKALWSPEQLPKLQTAQNIEQRLFLSGLLFDALNWIADYEQWALETLALDYRKQCAASWHKKIIPAEEVPAAWRRLAEQCQASYAAPLD